MVVAIIWFSIFFEAERLARYQQVAMSFQDIQNYTRIRSRRAVSGSQVTAIYALSWADAVTGQTAEKFYTKFLATEEERVRADRPDD